MAAAKLKERIPTQMQLHLTVEPWQLPDLMEEIAEAVLADLGMDPEEDALRSQVATVVESVLRHRVRAFELCGFTADCHGSKEYDPWAITEEVGSWPGI